MVAQAIQTVEQLEDLLSEPTPSVVEILRRLDGDIMLLGAGGKMGPTLARMARRASDAAGINRRVIAASRFSSADLTQQLHARGIETLSCDLLDDLAVARLPETPNVIFMAGRKFGSTGQEATTWAMNSYLPGVICRKFRRSRIVAFSTGNVYGLSPVAGGGSRETDAPSPVGEYAMSCLGRERVFEFFSQEYNIPMALIRLNYACELRYGLLVDLAHKVRAGEVIDLSMGHFNTIWQGDANAMALQAFAQLRSPPRVVNVTGPELLSVREVCEQFGRLMKRPLKFSGTECDAALLSNAHQAFELWGRPRVNAEQLIGWVADWILRGGSSLGKPTHFESRDGKF